MKQNNNFLQSYKNLKVLVTGSTGFKGSWLCFWLHHLNAKVIGIGLKEKKDEIIYKSLKINKKIKQYYLNINNFEKLNRVIKKEKPNIIFHLAAYNHVGDSFVHINESLKTNILGTSNLLEFGPSYDRFIYS